MANQPKRTKRTAAQSTPKPAPRSTKAKPKAVTRANRSTRAKTSTTKTKQLPAGAKLAKKPRRKVGASQRATKVDGYIAALGDWRKECMTRLRELIHESARHNGRSRSRSTKHSEHHGPLAWIRDHARQVNLGFVRDAKAAVRRTMTEARSESESAESKSRATLRRLALVSKQEFEKLLRAAAPPERPKTTPRPTIVVRAKPK